MAHNQKSIIITDEHGKYLRHTTRAAADEAIERGIASRSGGHSIKMHAADHRVSPLGLAGAYAAGYMPMSTGTRLLNELKHIPVLMPMRAITVRSRKAA
jgi:hypothetical protein